MHILSDKKGTTSGYLYNNVILLPGHKVAGVVLAHCVFTSNGNIKGKYFKGCIYNESGEIIANESNGDKASLTAEVGQRIMKDAWEILSRVKNHTAPWVIATEKWSKITLDEFLLQ